MLVWGPTPRVGLIREVIEDVGADKVACIVTDNAAAMVKARGLVVAMRGFTHISEIRHAAALQMKYPWHRCT
jgi:hypothetical protein